MEYTFELFELSDLEVTTQCELDENISDIVPYLVGHQTTNTNGELEQYLLIITFNSVDEKFLKLRWNTFLSFLIKTRFEVINQLKLNLQKSEDIEQMYSDMLNDIYNDQISVLKKCSKIYISKFNDIIDYISIK